LKETIWKAKKMTFKTKQQKLNSTKLKGNEKSMHQQANVWFTGSTE
jgi:hypothetical protein